MPCVPAGLAPRTSSPGRLPFALHASILIALLAASSAPTPLYPRYQAQWRLSALDITVVFSECAQEHGAASEMVGKGAGRQQCDQERQRPFSGAPR